MTTMATGSQPSLGRVRRMPGEEVIWLLIMAELAVFSVVFAIFLLLRNDASEVFDTAQSRLIPAFGLVNMVLLLISSWCVAIALELFRAGHGRRSSAFLGAAIALGLAFIAIKYTEYQAMLERGMALLDNNFTIFYFVLTGTHLTHVVVGVMVLAWFSQRLFTKGYTGCKPTSMEAGASYWHMVDLLWIVMFVLLYLLP